MVYYSISETIFKKCGIISFWNQWNTIIDQFVIQYRRKQTIIDDVFICKNSFKYEYFPGRIYRNWISKSSGRRSKWKQILSYFMSEKFEEYFFDLITHNYLMRIFSFDYEYNQKQSKISVEGWNLWSDNESNQE